ncbi:restriction endonuclease subunit S [Mordavella massiliensis]|nr:restriction endonuclease subunit S [Mordavella massiliensis]
MSIKLSHICKFQSGGTPAKGNTEYFNGNIPWITTIALTGGQIDANDAVEWITEKAIEESAAKIVPANSIMVGTRVGVGKVAVNTVAMSTSQDVISLLEIDESKWSKDYLCKYLQGKKGYLNSQARGATIKGIKIDVLSKLEVPEISLEDQIYISKIVDVVKWIIVSRKQELQKLDELIKARFVEMFGDIVLNPFNWEKELLGMVCDVRDGTHDSPKYYETGYPLVTSKNITGGKIDLTDCSLICEVDFKKISERSKVDIGDIIMPMIGTVGKPVIVDVEPNFAIKNVSLIKFKDYSRVLNTFIRALLQSDYFDDAVLNKIRGGTQKFISLGDIRKLTVIVPPMGLQEQFSAFVAQIDKSKLMKFLDIFTNQHLS